MYLVLSVRFELVPHVLFDDALCTVARCFRDFLLMRICPDGGRQNMACYSLDRRTGLGIFGGVRA